MLMQVTAYIVGNCTKIYVFASFAVLVKLYVYCGFLIQLLCYFSVKIIILRL